MSGKRPPTFYVFHGTDEFSCRAQLQTMRAQMGDMGDLNITQMDGKNVSVDQVLAAASSMPFLSDKRLVIVEGMLSWLGRKGAGKTGKEQLERLVQGLPQLPDFSRVVFVEGEALSDSNAIVKLAKSDPNGYHKLFAPPSDPAGWIMHHARTNYNVTIEASAASALAAVIGPDLRAADSEIAKLAAYVNYERPIREADVKQMTSYSAEASVFEMVDAIGRRDGATASRLLHQLLEEEEALMLFGMITRQFRLLLLAREYLNEGGNAAQIGAGIGVHEFVGKKLGQQVRTFTQDQLEMIYRFLLDTDAGIKTGKVGDVLALDLLLAGISS